MKIILSSSIYALVIKDDESSYQTSTIYKSIFPPLIPPCFQLENNVSYALNTVSLP